MIKIHEQFKKYLKNNTNRMFFIIFQGFWGISFSFPHQYFPHHIPSNDREKLHGTVIISIQSFKNNPKKLTLALQKNKR